jgi:hypothetical protein
MPGGELPRIFRLLCHRRIESRTAHRGKAVPGRRSPRTTLHSATSPGAVVRSHNICRWHPPHEAPTERARGPRRSVAESAPPSIAGTE